MKPIGLDEKGRVRYRNSKKNPVTKYEPKPITDYMYDDYNDRTIIMPPGIFFVENGETPITNRFALGGFIRNLTIIGASPCKTVIMGKDW